MSKFDRFLVDSFNTQPPEGGWQRKVVPLHLRHAVSTHSRLKAAGMVMCRRFAMSGFQHTAA